MSEKRKVVIDCDPGIDDTFALVMCINKLDVKGIVAVGGNTGLEYTQRNARYVTELTKRTDIPVYAGYDMPILNQLVRATEVHGSGGVGDAVIEEPAKQLEKQHIFTHITWQLRCYYVEVSAPDGGLTWVDAARFARDISLPTAFRQFWESP